MARLLTLTLTLTPTLTPTQTLTQAAARARLARPQSERGQGDAALGVTVLHELHALLRAASTFGGLFIAFGPAYSWLLLRMLYDA